MLISSPIQNLIGGINQQPASIRTANEAESVDNAMLSPVEGLLKRPPTELVSIVADASGALRYIPTSQTLFVHMIERDETEKYLLTVQEDGTADIYDLAGNRKTLYIDASTSLGSAAASKRKALTVGDVTFLVNGNTLPAYLTGAGNTVSQTPSNFNRAALLWVKQSNYNRTHTVKLTSNGTTTTHSHNTWDVRISAEGGSGTNGTYSPVQLTATSGSPTKATTYPTARIVVSGGKVTQVNLLTPGDGWDTSTIDAVLTATGNANIPTGFNLEIKSASGGEIGTTHVAEALFNGKASGYVGPYQGISGTSPYTASTYADGVIYVQSSTNDFTVVVEDDFAGDGIVYIRDKVERFEDLPPTAPHNYMVQVVGSPESEFDDYWVQFKADNNSFSRGVWEECPSPGMIYKWDSSTMPLILIRQSNGTFMLKKADGTTPASNVPAGANYTGYKWSNRLVGDDTTNPFPSFLGMPVQDLVFHQNRLGFLSGENLIFSETSDFFNYFRTTTLDLVDSDPIDVASSSPRVGKIMSAVPFNRDLILFTPTGQMVLRSGETLSPKSVAIIPVADYDNQSSVVEPIPSASSVFFTYSNGGYTGMRELVPQPALDGSYLSNDLTSNVSRLIPGIPTSLSATTHANMAVVVSEGKMYCYRYYDSNGERLQSAWFQFSFDDSSNISGNFAKALWCGFLDATMYMVMLRTRTNSTGYISIEKMRFGEGINDSAISGKDWLTHLDQRVYQAAGSGTYSSTTGLTTFTLPKPMSYAAGKTAVVTVNGLILSTVGGTAFNTSTEAAGTVQVIGNYSNTAVWIGTNYSMAYEFSTPYLKGRAGNREAAMLVGRYQLRYLTLQYADSAYFRVTATVKGEQTYEYPFTGEILGLFNPADPDVKLLDGSFRVPIMSKNDNLTIKIINDSPLPSKILSGEIEASYDSRASRYSG